MEGEVEADGLRSGRARVRATPRTAYAAATAVSAATGLAIYADDPYLTGVHALLTTAALGAAAAFATRRALASALLCASVVALVLAVAHVKRLRTDFILHAWDLFDPAMWTFSPRAVLVEHPLAGVVMVAALAAAALLPLAIAREEPNVRRTPALAALALFAAAAAAAAYADAGPRQTQYTFPDRRLSSFYSSWAPALETLVRGRLMEAAREPTGSFEPAPACAPKSKPPHVILIHQESVVDPGAVPGLARDPRLDDLFRSHDGTIRPLRVETYGGASWLTEFSVLTGAASRSFGGMRQFVQIYMAGRMRDALPLQMQSCGYRNVMFYPYLRGFFGSGPFFGSVGLREIFDARAQKAGSATEPDRFYYANALDEIGRHVGADSRPLFVYLQTMSAHWPYDVVYWPERQVPDVAEPAHPEMREYLRRLFMAREDFVWLRETLSARYPDERFLIILYGDHQPLATRFAFGFDREEIEDMNRALPIDSPAFRTFYASVGVNYAPPPLPEVAALDGAWLGVALLEQAGLPLAPSWRERARLMRACDGAYALCPDRDAILRFHRRLMDTGLVADRPDAAGR